MNNIIRTIPAKVFMYIMTCITAIVCIIFAGMALFCYEEDLYNKTLSDVMNEKVGDYTYSAAKHVLYDTLKSMSNVKLAYDYGDGNIIIESGKSDIDKEMIETLVDYGDYSYNVIPNNYIYSVTDVNGKVVDESKGFDKAKTEYTYYLVYNSDSDYNWNTEKTQKKVPSSTENYMTVMGYYKDGVPNLKSYRTDELEYKYLYYYLNDAIIIAVISGFAALILYITLMCVSARRPKSDELLPGYLNRVPYDVVLAVACLIVALICDFADTAVNDDMTGLVVVAFVLSCLMAIFVGLSMDAAARIKQGTLLSNTLTMKVIKLCWAIAVKIIKWFWRLPSKLLREIKNIIEGLPLIWKTVAFFCGISFINLIALLIAWDCDEMDMYVFLWFFANIVLFVLVCRFVLGLRGLQAAGRALALGDYEHRVDTSKLYFDFKEHGENLNHISDGMITAVEEKMKSERMKTELITNVSHDIKTPLTSIINYADLIGKEQTDNENIKEYTEVLLRQSERLKRLIEDLVEASKASTGNLEVELAPCDASMFITQIAGEYEEKLNRSGLTLITKGLDNSAYIMADGRRMLRVFDNLMNNICKYALENSRVYLSLEVSENSDTEENANGGLAVITFKNTSRTELDVSPEELMERFVRGDQSRNTEGNGLGLSIARSLTELQNGTFDIKIDGDLFKVVLTFPKIK